MTNETKSTPIVGLCSRKRAEYLMGAAAHAGGGVYPRVDLPGMTGLGVYLCCGTLPSGEPVADLGGLDPKLVLPLLYFELGRLARLDEKYGGYRRQLAEVKAATENIESLTGLEITSTGRIKCHTNKMYKT